MSKIDIVKLEKAFSDVLEAMGKSVSQRNDMKETPKKIAESYLELFSGIDKDPKEQLRATFDTDSEDLVIEKDIDFSSMCEHHFLPFFGKADIAYIPNGKIVGFGSIIRVVEILSKRPQIQERLTQQLADVIYECLGCKGVAVILHGVHTCMTMRGIKKENSKIITAAYRGIFDKDPNKRSEVLYLLNRS